MKNRILSVILSVSLVLSVMTVGFIGVNAEDRNTITFEQLIEKYKSVYNDGYNVPKTEDFMQVIVVFGQVYEKLTGLKIFTDDKISIIVEGYIKDVYDEVKNQSNEVMNFQLLFESLPISSVFAKNFYEVTKIEREEVIKYLNDKSNAYYNEGNDIIGGFYLFLRVYMNVFDEIVLTVVPVNGKDGIYEVEVQFVYNDGEIEKMYPGIYYNAETRYLYNRDGKGVIDLGYDINTNDASLETVVNSWQRNFGFCLFYDVFCYFTPFFDYITRRIKFEYGEKEWMIQIWKGRYIITAGCEVGIYTREKGSFGSFYNCASDDEMLPMSMSLYHGDDLVLQRPETLHWWLTSFRFTPKVYLPESLTLDASITFKDKEMTDAFMNSVKKIPDIKTERNENTVSLHW